MEFFVPGTSGDETEERYASLARWCNRPAPDAAHRISSILFVHDGAHWRATVGERLSGTLTRGGKRVDVTERLSDPATVQAIFAGNPYLVVTDGRPLTDVVSAWVNPFMAGIPNEISHFED